MFDPTVMHVIHTSQGVKQLEPQQSKLWDFVQIVNKVFLL